MNGSRLATIARRIQAVFFASSMSASHRAIDGFMCLADALLQYPVLPDSMLEDPENDIRAGAHSDYGSITLLYRLPHQPGLEILTPEGSWATVPVDPESGSDSGTLPILVNIGDLLSYWTDGLLKSTVHRVIFPKQDAGPSGREDRYSIAYFCHPQDDATLIEIPSEVVSKHGREAKDAPRGASETLTARDHLNSRLAATYGVKVSS